MIGDDLEWFAARQAGVLELGLLAVVAALLGWDLVRTRSSLWPGRWRALAVGARLAAFAAIAVLTLEVSLRESSGIEGNRRLVGLVDRSASTAIADGSPIIARHQRAGEVWAMSEAWRESWIERGIEVEWIGFDAESHPLTAEDLAATPAGRQSDLARALQSLKDDLQRPVAGVWVISDGLVTDGHASQSHLMDVALSLGVPISTVAVGATPLRDVSISSASVGEFAFVETPFPLEVEIEAHGCSGENAKVELFLDGTWIAAETVRLSERNGAVHKVAFRVIPEQTGASVYEVKVEPLRGEATIDNNRRAFPVVILRDKVRALHVAGRPDWDVRALRTLLKRDPNVELLSYYILRDQDDVDRADAGAPVSLIPFPTGEIFGEQLPTFDLVILHNFDAASHGDYLGSISNYVLEGGALVVIGGDMGLANGDFAGTGLAEVLPLDVSRATGMIQGRFRPRVSEIGRRHPITRFLAEGGSWEQLPELDTLNPSTANRDAAGRESATLLVHPERQGPRGEDVPILAISEAGKGRTVILATGSSWRLGFAPDVPLVDGVRPYDRLWLGIVHWLLRDEENQRLSVDLESRELSPAQRLNLAFTSRTSAYSPEPEVEITWSLTNMGLETAKPIAGGLVTTDTEGRFSLELEPLPVGSYAVEASRAGDDRVTRRVFVVQAAIQELARLDAVPGTALLQRLAEQSGGSFTDRGDGESLDAPLVSDRVTTTARAASQRVIPVWAHPLWLVLLCASLGGEWIVRRRLGSV